MGRLIVHFKDENINFVNIVATDIFEQGEYLHIYNGNDLVAVFLKETIKIIYKSVQRGETNG